MDDSHQPHQLQQPQQPQPQQLRRQHLGRWQSQGQLFLDLGKPLNCLSVAQHPGATLVAAVGGAQMLKVVGVTPHGLEEKRSLRLTSKVTSEVNVSINDVEWCCKDAARHVLAAGASNGHILLWDVSRDGRTSQERVISAHPRTVNRINWHPQEEDVLLSASQDTTVKLWDRRGRLYDCQAVFQPRAESVRDVQWNPSQTHLFAAACEQGSVQLWDRRKPGQTPLLRIRGHNGLVLALEWHLADPFLLVTGARDRTVKVWDVSDQTRDDLKERHVINTVSAVSRIKWRPGYPEQLTTTSSVQGDNAIHLWNVRHPHLPLATLDGHSDVCGGITWLDTPCLPGGATATAAAGGGAREGPTSGSLSSSGGGEGGDGAGGGGGQYRSMSSRLFGAWGAGVWGEAAARDEDKKGLEQYTEYMGVWQHLLSCGRDGNVIFHALARGTRPRETLTPTVLALSARGEVATAYERIDCSLAFVGLVDNESTRAAPGIYAARSHLEEAEGVEGMAQPEGMAAPEASTWSDASQPPVVVSPGKSMQSQLMHGSVSLTAAATTEGSMGRQHQPHAAVSAPVSTLRRQRHQQLQQSSTEPSLATRKAMSVDSAPTSSCDWRARLLYRLRWDEPALRGSSTDEVAAALERVMLAQEGEIEKGQPGGGVYEDTICPSFSFFSAPTVLRGPEQIAYLAKHYVLRPRGVPLPLPSLSACQRAREDLCQYNAEAARMAGQLRMAHVWEVLAVLLTGHQGLSPGAPADDGFDYATGRRTGGEGFVASNQQHPSPAPASSRAAAPDGLGGAAGTCLQLLRCEVLTGVVEELLEEGDIQNAVAVMEVLASTCPISSSREGVAELVDVERARECYLGYVELLQRLELWQAATELARGVEDKAVRQLHATNTTTYASCAQCRRPLGTVETLQGPQPSLWCGRCRALVSQCAICLQPVRGVYVWCPGCSHGGHVAHMQEWFGQGNRECPTGCGHACNLFAAPAPPPPLLFARQSSDAVVCSSMTL